VLGESHRTTHARADLAQEGQDTTQNVPDGEVPAVAIPTLQQQLCAAAGSSSNNNNTQQQPTTDSHQLTTQQAVSPHFLVLLRFS